MHGMCGYFMTISRLLVGADFHLKVLIVFEILYSYNTKGGISILRCIGYKLFL